MVRPNRKRPFMHCFLSIYPYCSAFFDFFFFFDVSDDRRPIFKSVVYSSNSNVCRNLSFENMSELYRNAKIGDLGLELSRFRNGFKEQRNCPDCQRANDLEKAPRLLDVSRRF